MKKYLILCLLAFIITTVPAQRNDTYLDSLKALIDYQQADTNTVQNLIRVSRYFSRSYTSDSVLYYAHQVVQLSKTLRFNHGLASGYRDIGINYWQQGELDSALHYTDLTRQTFLAHGDSLRFINATHLNGMILGDYGRFEEALGMHYQTLRYYEQHDKAYHASNALNSIGIIHGNLGNYPEAKAAYVASIDYAEQAEDLESKANAMSNLGDLYSRQDSLDQALAIFQEVLRIDQELEMEWGIGFQLSNIAVVYNKQGRYEEAEDYVRQALVIRRKLGQQYHTCSNLLVLGYVLINREKYAEAVAALKEAQSIAEEIGANDFLFSSYEDLSRAYAGMGQFEQAYKSKLESDAIRDTVYSLEMLEKVEELTQQYEAEKREATIALLNAEKKLDKRVQQGLGLGILLLLVIGLLVLRNQRKQLAHQQILARKNEEIQESAFQQTRTELELKALRAQMNPHFIFNCMNSINRMILADENEQASRNLTKFSRLIRMILEHSEKDQITLQEELSMLETYIQLESQRFKDRISYSIEVDPELDTEDIELPSMVLQPFIENAIWHGLMHKEEGEGQIQIQIKEQDGVLHCSIEDNGVGREKAMELKQKNALNHQSMAMKVTRERLSLLDRSGLGELIRIIDLKDKKNRALGTRVELSIPI